MIECNEAKRERAANYLSNRVKEYVNQICVLGDGDDRVFDRERILEAVW